MERTWAAEVIVDPRLASALIEDQFPGLRPVRVIELGAGWDTTVYRANERFVFRFPRRQVAADLIDTELACLPALTQRLPVAIPQPLFVGRPSAAFPWPFAGYHFIRGQRAMQTALSLTQRRRLAAAVARFLKALHAIGVDDVGLTALPADRLARLDAQRRRVATEERLVALRKTRVINDSSPILRILDEAPAPSSADGTVVAHGDLHAGQLIVRDGALAGVIDWSDIHRGHPAVDLAVAHQLIPTKFHHEFLDIYGPVDDTMWRLARARATWHAVAVLASSVDTSDTPLAAEAKTALGFITGSS